MTSRTVLVVYFSQSGTTRTLAETIARELDADLEEIRETTKRRGILGVARSMLEVLLGRSPGLRPSTHDPSDYALVLIGTPVWAASVSGPVRAYLGQHKTRFPRVAFFATEGGRGADHVFSQMSEILGKQPEATLVLRQRDVVRTLAPTRDFVVSLGRASAGERLAASQSS
ncbi:MAG TPA: flavodoxin [Polyangiaceae bacterium]|nr:flavodoxin [Polyangiaceae bacterium]